MIFLDLTIKNGYLKEDIVYFLNETYSSKIIRKSARKTIYLMHKKLMSNTVVKLWYERGILRNLKNYIKGGSRAVREAKNMLLLQKNGVCTPLIVSYGNFKKKNVNGYISFIITEQVSGVDTYGEYVRKFYSQEGQRTKFYAITEEIVSRIAKMHLNGLTHNDIHMHNILAEIKTADDVNVYFLDTLAVRKRKNRTFYSLFDIAKFYFWMQNDPSKIIIQKKEREYIIQEYFKKAIKIYHFNYSIFRFLLKSISNYIKKTYRFSKLLRNIQ